MNRRSRDEWEQFFATLKIQRYEMIIRLSGGRKTRKPAERAGA